MAHSVPPVRLDPLIIGAGPAGTAAAITLGQAGGRPVVLERAAGPIDKVCGDFLSLDAIHQLRALGVDPAALGAAPIDRIRLIHGRRVSETALPFPAMGLSRRILDQALIERARASGATVRGGQAVRQIDREPGGWMVQVIRGDTIAAPCVFLATGKHDLRGRPRAGTESGAVGMKLYFQLTPRQTASLSRAIELILFPGGYAGLQCVEDGRVVVCVAVQRERLQQAGGTWPGLLQVIGAVTPHLHEVLAGAVQLLPRPLAVAGIPYGLLHRSAGDQADGLFRLGDQAAVIPSLTGDGIAMALYGGTQAARAWLRDGSGPAYQNALARELGGQMLLAKVLHTACMAGPIQSAVVRGAAWFPGLLRKAARSTRVAALSGMGRDDRHHEFNRIGDVAPEPMGQ